MKEKIIEIFENCQELLTIKQLQEYFPSVSSNELTEALEQLKSEYIIYESKKHRFGLLDQFGLHIGTINLKEKGFGFIKCDGYNDDFFVPRSKTLSAMNKDKVLFRILQDDEAEVIEVVNRALSTVIGKVYRINDQLRFRPFDEKNEIYIEVKDYSDAKEEDVVIVKVSDYINSGHLIGNVVNVIGRTTDIGIEISAIALKYDFSLEFSKEAIEEIYNIDITDEIKKRKFIDRKIITIDGDDAKDLDDAVCVEKKENGNYFLGVYIADVSYFVQEDSLLDQEALQRGTSVYLVDRVIPMLPFELSNDLCSLNELTKKLVMACEMEINPQGNVVNFDIFEGVIESKHRMTYNNVNKMINGETLNQYLDIQEEVKTMLELSNILSEMRNKKGCLNFDIPEPKIIVDEQGKVIDIQMKKRYEAEKIIEQFMITANETVASCINNMDLAFIYRVHDTPNELKLQKFTKILKNSLPDYQVKGKKLTSHNLQDVLINPKTDYALSTMLLRLMAKAKYSEINIGHYGLASTCYTHFTSPIRRYPDLLVHRLLRKYLINSQINEIDQSNSIIKIANIANQCSKKERDAIDCEYEVNDMKMAEYMESHLNEKYEGIISSVTNFGLFVMLDNGIEGLIRIKNLKDDYYEYEQSRMLLIGRHSKKTYRLGDKIKIRVLSASKSKREIEFSPIYNTNNNMLKYSRVRKNDHERKRTKGYRKK